MYSVSSKNIFDVSVSSKHDHKRIQTDLIWIVEIMAVKKISIDRFILFFISQQATLLR